MSRSLRRRPPPQARRCPPRPPAAHASRPRPSPARIPRCRRVQHVRLHEHVRASQQQLALECRRRGRAVARASRGRARRQRSARARLRGRRPQRRTPAARAAAEGRLAGTTPSPSVEPGAQRQQRDTASSVTPSIDIRLAASLASLLGGDIGRIDSQPDDVYPVRRDAEVASDLGGRLADRDDELRTAQCAGNDGAIARFRYVMSRPRPSSPRARGGGGAAAGPPRT